MASKENTGGGEGVEVIKNEPYEKENEKGQYTYKIFRLASRVPAIVKAVAPAGALDLYEEVSVNSKEKVGFQMETMLNRAHSSFRHRHGMHILIAKLVSWLTAAASD